MVPAGGGQVEGLNMDIALNPVVTELIDAALAEDLSNGDVTSELLMPSGVLLGQEGLKEMLKEYYDAFYRAGAEVVRQGRISSDTELAVQKPPFPPEDFYEMANQTWDNALKEAGAL